MATAATRVRIGSQRVVRHRCGYPLLAKVIDVFEWCPAWRTAYVPPAVVVNYRDRSGQVVFLCPGCGISLQLWWDLEEGHQEG